MSQIKELQIPNPTGRSDETNLTGIQDKLRTLERRDWWLWSSAVIVMLLLTFAVFSMNFPGLFKTDDPFLQASLDRAVRGLVELVLIFNAYTIYQQVTVKRLRKQFSRQLAEMRILQIRSEEFKRLAQIDPLTGLCNRRVAEERLTTEASRLMRHGHSLTLMSFDLNNFKQINDTFGHPAGDLVLQHFAARLNSTIRLTDLAARLGGDEFLILLPECPTDQVERILARLRDIEVTYEGHKIPISFSAGWVGYERGETTEQFMARADRMLYAEKHAAKSLPQETVAVS